MKQNGGFGATTGGYACFCVAEGESDDCGTKLENGALKCNSQNGKCSVCMLTASPNPNLGSGGIAIKSDSSTGHSDIKWKRVVFPSGVNKNGN